MRRSKSDRSLVFFLLLIAVVAVWDESAAPAHGRSLDEIKASGELHVCIAPISPAFAVPLDSACRDDCAFSGPVYREVMAFVEHLGHTVRPVFHRVDWDEQFHDEAGQTDREAVYTPHLLASGKCDVYPSHVTKNSWRLKKLDFAVLFRSRMMVIVNRSRRGILKTPADLAGKTAAVEMNSSFHTWLAEQNESAFAHNPVVIRLMTLEESLNAVRKGQVDFTLVDADIALWQASHAYRDLDVAFPVGTQDEIGWAFDVKDHDLRKAVQDFFDAQVPNETSELNRIWKDEFGVTIKQLQTLIHATE